jgi:hypothetical protein
MVMGGYLSLCANEKDIQQNTRETKPFPYLDFKKERLYKEDCHGISVKGIRYVQNKWLYCSSAGGRVIRLFPHYRHKGQYDQRRQV